jgi:ribose transport system ATP-binding protein
MTDVPTTAPRTALSVRGVSKRFGATRALRGVHLELRAGEVHALIGGNGCGKSTLIKCLAGVYEADAGELELNGRSYDLTRQTPETARDAGLRFVHQDLGIFPMMSLTENLSLGHGFEVGAGRRVRWRQAHKRAKEVLTRFGIDADPRAPAASLSVPQHAMLAIARALQDEDEDGEGGHGGVLVLDEPTASLPAAEVDILLEAIRGLAKQGHAILMVTHRLDEVRQVADRVTGFRDGAYVGTMDGAGLSEQDLVELILGRRLEQAHSVRTPSTVSNPVLEVRHVRGGPVQDVSFAVGEGEVLGIAGLLGSGRTELLQMIYGLLPMHGGEIVYQGETLRKTKPSQMCRKGVAFIPEDRHAEAVFPLSSVRENMLAGHEHRYFRGGWLRDRAEQRETAADVQKFNIRTDSTSAMIESLSGGNQQKVVIARWLRQNPTLLLLDEPTQGVDVGARDEIYKLIAAAADQGGCGVIVVSSEFEELARICGRVLVLARGRIVTEHTQPMTAQDLLESSIGSMEAVA